mgnify:CR=1 FL=1
MVIYESIIAALVAFIFWNHQLPLPFESSWLNVVFSAVISIALLVISVVLFYFYRTKISPRYLKSKNYHNPKSAQYKAMRKKFFFPGFSNGWHAVCSVQDVENKQIKTISALGSHMVAFKGENGKIGVLDAFCPHLGAHLGEGGKVKGSSIECPFHNWSFDAEGKCVRIPYMEKAMEASGEVCAVPARTSTKAYPVRVYLGMVFIWFHAEEEHRQTPLYEPDCLTDLHEQVEDGSWSYVLMRNVEFEQHSCEMAMNSADQHHFDTLHAPFPIPIIDQFVTGVHTCKAIYEQGVIRGKVEKRNHYAHFTEKTIGLYFSVIAINLYPAPRKTPLLWTPLLFSRVQLLFIS